MSNRKLKYKSEKDFNRERLFLKEICQGETGCFSGLKRDRYLQGIARILIKREKHNASFIFEEGDILVTIMTDPSCMPIFVKASAIITDEGGLTCHAVIESNNLQIGCILNTIDGSSRIPNNEMIYLKLDDFDLSITHIFRAYQKYNMEN